MGAPGDLTTLANVKAWRSPPITTTSDDAQIARVITAASGFIQHLLQRRLVSQTYVETRNGTGGRALMLRHAPVTSLAALTIDGCAIPAAPDAVSAGWVLEAETGMLDLRGYAFRRGVQNIGVTYVAGYLVASEAHAVPGAAPYQLPASALAQLWANDSGVSNAAGGALMALAQGATPMAGQYVPPSAPDGFYQFAAADAGAAVLISYSFTPQDLQQACIELALLRINERARIGDLSKTLAGEVVSFVQRDMTASIASALQPYRRVVPIT
ncbi:MAG TPA: hypothetical protein VL993_00130 [Stellaceae bacterium]|nr:hypothetical protein [Stellaceae bacterium]